MLQIIVPSGKEPSGFTLPMASAERLPQYTNCETKSNPVSDAQMRTEAVMACNASEKARANTAWLPVNKGPCLAGIQALGADKDLLLMPVPHGVAEGDLHPAKGIQAAAVGAAMSKVTGMAEPAVCLVPTELQRQLGVPLLLRRLCHSMHAGNSLQAS
jgi:hypothetical protein